MLPTAYAHRPFDLARTRTTATAELVAAVIAGKSTLVEACRALRAAGWRSTIAGHRIVIDDRVFARFIDAATRACDSEATTWVIYGVYDKPAVRITL